LRACRAVFGQTNVIVAALGDLASGQSKPVAESVWLGC
jgi:hypothetical protein